ncbi:MAG: ATP-binding protein [Caulobacteraceae bacterium]
MLNRLRLFEKTLLPLVLTATLFAITVVMGVTVLHRTVASYREILSRNAPAVLRIERLNALTDQIGYSVARNLGYRCLGADAAACVRTGRDLAGAVAEGEQRLDEAVRFDPGHRADYEHFRQAFRGIAEPARAAMALGMKDDDARSEAMAAPIHERILALSEDLFRYSSQRTARQPRPRPGPGRARRRRRAGHDPRRRARRPPRPGHRRLDRLRRTHHAGPAAVRADGAAGRRRPGHPGGRPGPPRRDRTDGQGRAGVQGERPRQAAGRSRSGTGPQRRGPGHPRRPGRHRPRRPCPVGRRTGLLDRPRDQPADRRHRRQRETGLRWLERTPPDLDRARSAIERTVRDAKRASAIVSRVRGMLAKTEPEFTALDVNAVIEDVLGFIEDERRRAEVTVLTRLAARLPLVMADPIQLQQVLLNLVINGMDAMRANPAGARALFLGSSAVAPNAIEVTVEDRGSGIDPGVIDRVFDPFFTTKTSGVGLGLSITRSIVVAHGGRIWAESAEPVGARFRFVLPVAQLKRRRRPRRPAALKARSRAEGLRRPAGRRPPQPHQQRQAQQAGRRDPRLAEEHRVRAEALLHGPHHHGHHHDRRVGQAAHQGADRGRALLAQDLEDHAGDRGPVGPDHGGVEQDHGGEDRGRARREGDDRLIRAQAAPVPI